MPPITLNQLISIVVGLILLMLSGTTWYYHHEYAAIHDADLLLKHDNSVAQQQATAKLKQLTDDRDKAQKLLDDQAKQQGIKDAQAKDDISKLHDQLLSTPIRVQYIASPASRSSSASDPAATAADRAADETAASGVLPESNSRRLADALAEVETLSAAYNSCRAVVMQP